MQKTSFNNFKLIAFGLVLCLGASMMHGAFTEPSAGAPLNNVPIPVHTIVGGDQVKNGGLSVNTFVAAQNAQFDQQLFLRGVVHGGTPTDTLSTVYFGEPGTNVAVSASGVVSADDYIKSSPLQNPNSNRVCADQAGTLVLCAGSTGGTPPGGGIPGGPIGDICNYYPGTQTVCASGQSCVPDQGHLGFEICQ